MDWLKNNLFNLITALVAVYGAVLSTVVFLAGRIEKRRRVNVKLSIGVLASPPEVSPTMLLLEASNPGHRTVTLVTPSIRLPNGNRVIPPLNQSDVRFPYDLQGGKNCTVWLDAREFAMSAREHGFSGKIKIRARFTDGVGGVHLSKPLKFDGDGWCKGSDSNP